MATQTGTRVGAKNSNMRCMSLSQCSHFPSLCVCSSQHVQPLETMIPLHMSIHGPAHGSHGFFSSFPSLHCSTLESLITWLLVASAVALAMTLLPVFSTAVSLLECRYWWPTTAAFLAPAAGSHVTWGFAVAVIGGLSIGGGSACTLIAVGACFNIGAVGKSTTLQYVRMWRVLAASFVCLVILAILIGLNAGLVFIEESPKTSGAVRYVVALVFAVLHEVVDYVLTPLIVTVVVMIAIRTSGSGARPSDVFAAAVGVEVANSVLAPVVALLGVSEGCFRDQLFSHPESVETFVDVGYCTVFGRICPTCPTFAIQNEETCIGFGGAWLTYPVGVSYTPPFRFDGGRCISSIITLYTPEYLVIFALRIIVYPLGWWMARRGTPWIVTGMQPPTPIQSTFLSARRRLVRFVTC